MNPLETSSLNQMSSPSNQSKTKTWILIVLGIIVILFLGVSVVPLLNNPGTPQQGTNNPANPNPTQPQEDLASKARGYEAVLEREPENQSALQGLLEVRIQQGDIEGALIPLEKLADLNPEQEAYRLLLAQGKQQIGDLEGAATAYRKILDETPANIRALQGLVDLFLQQNRPEAAIGELEDTLELAENSETEVDTIDVKLLLAQVYSRTEKLDGAIEIYQEVAADNPGDFRPVLGQALVQQRKGNEEVAKPLYEKAFNLAPPQFKDQIKQMTSLLSDENTPSPSPESEE